MDKIKKALWFTGGILFLVLAYIGAIVPGIPVTTPALLATYCFARSSKKFHDYMINHKIFGPLIVNWNNGKVFPTKAKWTMFICMDSSLVILWFATGNWKAVLYMAIFFALIIFWASRYPGSKEEADTRIAEGRKLGWFK